MTASSLQEMTVAQAAQQRLRVLMITEGTYPFHWGGVSTWCHLLMRDLPNIDFELLSLAAEPGIESQFTLPANVVNFRTIPLWGIRELLEDRSDLTLTELYQRKTETTEALIAYRFVPLFRQFLQDLLMNQRSPKAMAETIHAMHRFFLTYDFDATLRSQVVWHTLVDVVQETFPTAAARLGYPDARYQLSDLTTIIQWLYHWLFPLGAPLPKADVAHAAMVGICTMIAICAKLEHGAAIMLTEHGIYLRERYLAESKTASSFFLKVFNLSFARRMTELTYALADQISPCCDYNHRWELRNGAKLEQIRTIYYGVDSDTFSPVPKTFGEPPVVVWVGRIDPLKDLVTLIRAAGIVHQTRPDIEFRLFGSAPAGNEAYYEECLKLRKELGLETVVNFAGYRSNVAAAFNEGDVVVLSSISEAFPFVILEAMLCAKPVVATSVGGIPEQLSGCGFALEPRNPHAMAEAILKLMDDEELCATMGQASRAKAEREFTVRQSGLAHDASYRRILKRTLIQRAHAAAQAIRTVAPPPRRRRSHVLVQRMMMAQSLTATAQQTAANLAYQTQVEAAPFTTEYSSLVLPFAKARNGHGNRATSVSSARQESDSGYAEKLFYAPPATSDNYAKGHLINATGHEPTTADGSNYMDKGNGSNRNGSNGNGSNGNGSRHKNGSSYGEQNGKQNGMKNEHHTIPSATHNEPYRIKDKKAIATLASEVAHRDREPVDALEITAVIESMGITDEVAQLRYGVSDAFALGDAIFAHFRQTGMPMQPLEPPARPPTTLWEMVGDFSLGGLAILPAIVLLLCIFAYSTVGQWSHNLVLALSAGLTSSMLITNGFIQALSRRTSIYLGLGKPGTAGHFLWRAIAFMLSGLLVGMLIVELLARSIGLFSGQERAIFALAFFSLAALWMAAGGLSLIQKTGWLALGMVVGLAGGAMADRILLPFTKWHLLGGSLVGYGVAMCIIILALRRGYAEGDRAKARKPLLLPTRAYLFYEASPYFTYGVLYMAFILLPHILGWFGALGVDQVRSWAVTSVEIGLTASMPPIIIANGVAEHVLRRFWRLAPSLQAETPGENLPHFHHSLIRFYRHYALLYLVALLVLSLGTQALFYWAVQSGALGRWVPIPDPEQLLFIFNAGLIAYGLLGMGIFSCMFCITIGAPTLAVRAVAWGLLATLLIGLPLSGIHYSFSALAFIAGSAFFVVVAWQKCMHVLRSSDYRFAMSL